MSTHGMKAPLGRRTTWLCGVAIVIAAFALLLLRRADAVGTTITLGAVSGTRGAQVLFGVTFQTPSAYGIATENDIYFNAVNTPILVGAGGKPSCNGSAALAGLNKSAAFSFLPSGCTGTACTTVRALVQDSGAGAPIPPGTTLYTCSAQIAATAPPGIYPLTAANVSVSTPEGEPEVAGGISGQITVTG